MAAAVRAAKAKKRGDESADELLSLPAAAVPLPPLLPPQPPPPPPPALAAAASSAPARASIAPRRPEGKNLRIDDSEEPRAKASEILRVPSNIGALPPLAPNLCCAARPPRFWRGRPRLRR